MIVFGHNALTPIEFLPGEWPYVIWSILHDQNDLGTLFGMKFRASYPVLPWFGVILLGYFAGQLYAQTIDALKRRKMLILGGISCLVIMLGLRWLNIYGETLTWSIQETTIGTIRDFLNFSKYPPSLFLHSDYFRNWCLSLSVVGFIQNDKSNNRFAWCVRFGPDVCLYCAPLRFTGGLLDRLRVYWPDPW